MSEPAAHTTDSAAAVTRPRKRLARDWRPKPPYPTPNPKAAWLVEAVEALPGFRLHVTFQDGTVGEVWMDAFLESPKAVGTVFEPLRDPDLFAQAGVVMGAVTWPNGLDLAPDAMYTDIRASGHRIAFS